MNIIKKSILYLLLLVMASGMAYGQIPNTPKTLLSPNAAGLGLYGEIPVSLFTGTPSIQIPLYEVQAENFKMPLSLSYHASGIRPDQHPGWAGLGWNINAGGVISRVVHDMPDDYNNSQYYLGAKAGFFFNYSVLNKSQWNERNYLRSVAQTTEKAFNDTEPDEFIFNFMGYSGKFLRTHTGEWEVQCDRPVKVEFNNRFLPVPFKKEGTFAQNYGYFQSFEGFTITTEDGTQYLFGGNTNSLEYSLNFFDQYRDEWIATSWYLTKIAYTDGQEVSFSYERGDFTNQMFLAVYHDLGSYTESSGGIFNPQPECSSWSITSIDASYQGKLIAPVYLNKIETSDLKIAFLREETTELRYPETIYQYQRSEWLKHMEYSFLTFLLDNNLTDNYPECLKRLKWYKLSNIQISSKKGALIRNFKFSYNDLSSQRLMLKSVEEVKGNSVNRTYNFKYKNPEKLPPYLSNQVDHWGYYNGQTAYLDYSKYYSYREPNANYLQYGILEKIEYPTGGYTRFVFEPHDYRKQLSFKRWENCEILAANKIAGGLRIKQIINSSTGDASSEVVTKEYYYSSDFLQNKEKANYSSGILGGQTAYSFSNYIVRAFNDSDVKRKMSMFSSQSVLPACENSTGNHIGYTEVIEKRSDGTFTRYQYTNFDNGHMDEAADAVIQESRTPYEPYNSKAVERGHLLSKEDYSKEAVLKRKKEFSYGKSFKQSGGFVRNIKAHYRNVCPGTAVSYDEGSSYRIYTYTYQLTGEKETVYDNPTTPLTTSLSYTYDGMGFISKTVQTLHNKNKETSYKRPYSCYSDACIAMTSGHILAPVIEQTESVTSSGQNIPVKRECYSYVPQPQVTNRMFTMQKMEQSIGKGELKEKYICHNFDAKGNALYVTENGEDIVYLWGYKNKYIVAEIRNATLTDVEDVIGYTTDFSAAEAPDIQKLALLRKLLKHAAITTFTYEPLIGITSITNSQGQTSYYQYDTFDRLSIERDWAGKTRKAYDYQYSTIK